MPGFVGAGIVLLALPLLFAMRTRRFATPPPAGDDEALSLPADLRDVRVLKARYGVRMEAGRVFEKEMWTETEVSTTTTPTTSEMIGNQHVVTPGRTSTRVITTVNRVYWVRTLDGREASWRFIGDLFRAVKGQIVSVISGVDGRVVAYNHATRRHFVDQSGFVELHRLPGRWVWLLDSLAATATFFVLARMSDSGIPPGSPLVAHDLRAVIVPATIGVAITAVIVAALYIGVLKAVFRSIRARQFRDGYLSKLLAALEAKTPELDKRMSDVPAV